MIAPPDDLSVISVTHPELDQQQGGTQSLEFVTDSFQWTSRVDLCGLASEHACFISKLQSDL